MTLLHVAIDARLPSGLAGGVRQVVLGLASGFRGADVPLRRTWLVTRDHDWLADLPPEDDVLVMTSSFDEYSFAVAERYPNLASRARPWVERVRRPPQAPFDERLRHRGVDVVHFTFQDAFHTRLPFVYQPHDLQHRHMPENFSAAQLKHRETAWRGVALAADAVCVGTRWVADDVARQWEIPQDRIAVIPLAPLPENVVDVATAREGRDVLLYPAAFWPHKNHRLLVEALAVLRSEGLVVPAVLPGAPIGEHTSVRHRVEELGMADQVSLPGYVSQSELDRLYDRTRVVAVPSRFESASFPVWEAMRRAIPVVASDVTALPRQLGDGGLIASPSDVAGWVRAIRQLWTDDVAWRRASTAGRSRAGRYSWSKSATAFASLYAHAAAGEKGPWIDTVFDADDLL